MIFSVITQSGTKIGTLNNTIYQYSDNLTFQFLRDAKFNEYTLGAYINYDDKIYGLEVSEDDTFKVDSRFLNEKKEFLLSFSLTNGEEIIHLGTINYRVKDAFGSTTSPLPGQKEVWTVLVEQEVDDYFLKNYQSQLDDFNQKYEEIKKIASSGSGGGSNVTVDSSLSSTSTNPVQNKIIKAELDKKAAKNEIPTNLSSLNEDETHQTVTAEEKKKWDGKSDFDGDFNSLNNIPNIPDAVIVDAELNETSTNAIQNQAVTKELAEKLSKNGLKTINGQSLVGSGNIELSAGDNDYELPIANNETLGGVKPVAKTDEMTQEVGVDEAGGLFTKEGDGIDEETLNQINRNTEDISKLSDEKANKTYVDEQIAKAQLEGAGVDTSQFVTQSDLKNINTGLTTAQVNALNEMFKVCAYTQSDVSTQYNAFKTAFGIGESGGEEPDTPITPTVTLSSITATYSGGDVLVGTDVDDLTGITVTGTYSDGTTKNIIDYALSGNINEGSNTITVSCEGKTTTFTVVGYVEQEEPSEPTAPVYKLASATTFDGTNHVDTGYVLNDVDKDFSILVEYVTSESTDKAQVFNASKNANDYGPLLRGKTSSIVVGNIDNRDTFVKVGRTFKKVITHKKDSGVFNVYNINDDVNFRYDATLTYSAYATNQHTIGNTLPLTLGKFAYSDGGYFKGTIYQFEIHERVITNEEIDTFIGATWEAPSEPTNLIDINTCTLGGSMPDGRQVSTDYYITDFIPIVSGNPYYTNITKFIDDSTSDYNQYYYLYNSSKQYKGAAKLDKNVAMGTNFDFTVSIINEEAIAYVRLVFHKNYKDIAFFSEGRL